MKKAGAPAARASAAPNKGGSAKKRQSTGNVPPSMMPNRDGIGSAGQTNPIPNILSSYDCYAESVQDYALPLASEWVEADIQAEKWATKHAYEESEIFREVPKSLRPLVYGYRRPQELIAPATPSATENFPSIITTQTINGAIDDDMYGWCIAPLTTIDEKGKSITFVLSS
jgi:hypothetical protein